MKSLLLVEDHPIFAGALIRALERSEDLKVVMRVDTAEKALQVIPNLKLDLILVDISLPKMSGIDFVGRLNQICPALPCLMISGHISRLYLKLGLAAGARGYAIKDNVEGIIEGIYQVTGGGIYISKELRTT